MSDHRLQIIKRAHAIRIVDLYYNAAYPIKEMPRKDKPEMIKEFEQFFNSNGIDLDQQSLTTRWLENFNFTAIKRQDKLSADDKFMLNVKTFGVLHALKECRADTTFSDKLRKVVDNIDIPSELREIFNGQFKYTVKDRKSADEECENLAKLIKNDIMDPVTGELMGDSIPGKYLNANTYREKYEKFMKVNCETKRTVEKIWDLYLEQEDDWPHLTLEARKMAVDNLPY